MESNISALESNIFTFDCVQGNTVYVKPGTYAMSSKKLETYVRMAQMQRYYQNNPVRFINDFFNIELLDVQAWLIQQSWTCPNVLWVCTRGLGKSTVIDLNLMAKGMLFNNYWSYIASGSGSQAEQTFTVLEKLANDNIDSFVGSTGRIFKNEIEIKQAAGDGFSHNSSGFRYNLYNGSMTQTLNSNVDKKRGFRGNVVFDECGFLSDELMSVFGAFAIVNQSFKSGKDRDGNSIDEIRLKTIPRAVPNQLYYISSASSTDTKFYELYRDFSKRMLIGDKRYFVAHVTCDVPLHPTIHGKVMAPLFEQSIIDSDMRTNPEKARREYYCEFTTDAGNDAIVRRGVITRNEETRKPLLYNDTGDKKFIIAYDPARQRDNSVILVGEVYDAKTEDGGFEKKMRLVNCVNLIDVEKKTRTPMQTPQQIEYLKQLILDYNGGADGYENILGIYIDAGSGGAGINIADFLMPDWTDKSGVTHRGLIDKEFSAEYAKKFPNAVDKIRMMSPSSYKSVMYEAMIELVNQNKISFTATYDHKGYLMTFNVDDKKFADEKKKISERLKEQNLSEEEYKVRLDKELANAQSLETKMVTLDWREEAALASIDALKEELVNMVRRKRETGRDSFELIPEKANRMHDDRAYTAAMAGYGLMLERRRAIFDRRSRTSSEEILDKLKIRKGTYFRSV